MASAARQNVKNQVEGRVSEAMQAVHAPVPPKPSANAVLEQLLDIPLLVPGGSKKSTCFMLE